MYIEAVCTGAVAENCFVVNAADRVFIIDPGADAQDIIQIVEKNNWQNLKIEVLFTHAHADHIGAAGELAGRFEQAVFRLDGKDLPIYESKDNAFPPFIPLAENLPAVQEYPADAPYKVLPCPGHTPGGVALLFQSGDEQHLFSGDTLFANSVGRTDFAGGSMKQLKSTLKMLVDTLDESVIVHPGHGPDTTIGKEKKNNCYLTDII